MKVLFFSRLFWPHVGGVEKHVLEVATVLAERGHTVTVVCERHSEDLPQRDYIGKILIYRIPVGRSYWFKKFRIWWWLLKNRKLMSQADVVHCHDVFFWFLPFHFLFPRKSVYTTFHGYEGRYPPSQRAILVRRLSAVLSKGNICVGDYIKKWYGTKADEVTYGGVNIKYPAFAKASAGKQNSKFKILFIGRLEKDTGINTYLNAIKLLRKKKTPFAFAICGDGPLREKAEKFGKVYGFVGDLGSYLDDADIIFTSSYLSILEALFHRKAVIAAYENPLKEDYLRMAPFADTICILAGSKKVSENVASLIKNAKVREEVADKAYRWVISQSWSKVADVYESLWGMKL